jgi:outer membrane immunogenic protein
VSSVTGGATGFHTDSFNRNGWFIGGGVENNLDFFGITSPGWFMKTEYRSSFYDGHTISELTPANVSNGFDVRANNWNQTVSTSLVYRFNWSGPVVAKY